MVLPDDVRRYIEQGLQCSHLEVSGDGHHFEAVIVSDAFDGKTRVARHQLVYAALGDRMREEIHALSMQTLTLHNGPLTANQLNKLWTNC